MGLIPSWSFSRLKDFESCPYKAWLKYSEKRPDTMDKTAANRGTMIHDACEKFVQGTGEFIKEMKHFRGYFDDLKIQFDLGNVILEENWGFDQNWLTTGWFDDNIWCRMKLDNFITKTLDEEKGHIIHGGATDYKSGKKYGNEVSHGQQGQIYAVGAFMRYPTLEVCDVELVYIDQNQTTKRTYTREKAMLFLPSWNKRALKMTMATDFPPKPTKVTCMWCPYGPQHGDGSCEWGV